MPDDIGLFFDADLMEFDLKEIPRSGDIALDEGFATACWISVYTDRRALDEDILPDSRSTNRRGWWGDEVLPEVEDDQIGSKLWLLSRNKTDDATLEAAKIYIEEALQWMIDSGAAAKIDVITEWNRTIIETPILAWQATIYKQDGSKIAVKFDEQWSSHGVQ